MFKWVIGIDNGVTGGIGIINTKYNDYFLYKTPIKNMQDYTKKKKNINRLDVMAFANIFEDLNIFSVETRIYIERPFVNPMMFNATLSAIRILEAQLCVLDSLNFSYAFVDSKVWQHALLPTGTKGKVELKKASYDVGNRLFPKFKDFDHPDRDALLIAEYFKREG